MAMNGHYRARVEEVDAESIETSQDFDMGSDDGSSSSSSSVPAKYDFYHPLPRTAQSGFVVRLETMNKRSLRKLTCRPNSLDSNPLNKSIRQPSGPFEIDDPPPLSPIEELEDDFLHQSIPKPEQGEAASIGSAREDGEDEFSLERRSELLFSRQHLELILADPKLSSRFTSFLRTYRPDAVPMLIYLLDTVKALKAIKYAEAIIGGLEPVPGLDFTSETKGATMSWVVEDKADRALEVLVKDDLPAFIAYVYVRTVDLALSNRVTRRENPGSPKLTDGLAEVFVLSDPAQGDNPIVFASEEFHEMTQYPRSFALGRNCRFLGGPKTDLLAITRFRASLDAEREHCEIMLNYRRDGTPFINLIMCVPLRDQYNKVRYFLGAQLDITGLVNECTELDSLRKLVDQQSTQPRKGSNDAKTSMAVPNDAFEQLGETFNSRELEVLLKLRRRLNPGLEEDDGRDENFLVREGPKVPLKNSITNLNSIFQLNGQGNAPPLGFYQNYLLVRPHPSLRILFASPDLRVAGLLQAPLMTQIGGSQRVRDDLEHALEGGRKVTAKVQWISKAAQNTRSRWIHCTPLLGINGLIAVWMVILVDDVQEEVKEPVKPPTSHSATTDAAVNAAEALPWEGKQPGLSGTIGNSFGEGSSSSSTSQAALSSDGRRSPQFPIPPLPERNRLRKDRPKNMPYDHPRDAMQDATISPFATQNDIRYNAKIWSENQGNESKQSMDDSSRPRLPKPRFGQPQDLVGDSVRPGPKISGRAYSINSNSDTGISADDDRPSSVKIEDNRPMSRSSSTSYSPAARANSATTYTPPPRANAAPVGPPIHMPGQRADAQAGADEKPRTRRTYKSLSPYGILFDD